jgi:uncharacterized protein involved in response to NO
MTIRRFFAPSLCLLFGLYCTGWSIVTSYSPTSMRVGGAFAGVFFLVLAYIYLRIILPHEQRENHVS